MNSSFTLRPSARAQTEGGEHPEGAGRISGRAANRQIDDAPYRVFGRASEKVAMTQDPILRLAQRHARWSHSGAAIQPASRERSDHFVDEFARLVRRRAR